ncbi:MAG TPA: methylenetetrahydromethanopterin dehydrogenase [Methylophaga aminisulfidivorans]|uniref:Methylenetetrahydromethanopterin dehydrogenase n=1 Tax=Methylophaga thalassica TaxID=40223 RepID=A0ABQ5TXP6_9GAMM|nr:MULTISPECIES: NAD(P)-dependent methylenetetrahydromethanopterin dehydrogenase [Methylophaga]GLQ00952.1 methylenetetrahydromethanopterin dehydrogenase [Methylophaga thalassica]HIC45688.1 methylenetetrahydromethanopterin dehydrogenase [Methylophaga sp.]HIM41234.1 methylenetetrahydromethanopterin dehydrogenase [Methylophaga aminisulfidivorans]
MSKRSIIHMLNPMKHNSPFDINMALDAGYDVLIPYSHVELSEVAGLTQDAIFSRGPSGVKKTGMFIGGRDIGLAMDMLDSAKKSMVPPFEISVFADPSGAFTTAAALVACVERELKSKFQQELKGAKAVVFGGTGPVGIATAVIAALQGAETAIVDHFSIDTALEFAAEAKKRYGVDLRGTTAASDADKARLLSDADIVFCAAKAGVQVLNASVLRDATKLKVAGDVNAVSPLGIEGVKLMDFGAPLAHATNSPDAVGIGALAIGDVKYKLQQALLRETLESEKPVYLDFRNAFEGARKLV